MKLNGISKIKEEAGEYIVLTDYGMEGISVSHQAKTAAEAVTWALSSGYGSPHTVVKLVSIDATDSDLLNGEYEPRPSNTSKLYP